MGHAAPFAFDREYRAAPGMRQFLSGTPPILSMGVLDAALDVFAGVDIRELRDKSRMLGELFLELAAGDGCLAEFELVSPPDSAQRGSQLALAHPQAFGICQAMIDRGVIADFRAPDVLRLGFAPLYLRYSDIARSVEVLGGVMANKSYAQEKYLRRQKVT
jgi:kynureninase